MTAFGLDGTVREGGSEVSLTLYIYAGLESHHHDTLAISMAGCHLVTYGCRSTHGRVLLPVSINDASLMTRFSSRCFFASLDS